ncbi:MAG: peptidylprolyl isomerase [Lachnospiraceae bacterium]|nr:peptidylprolyl isomerase [Lachnospiraceae bacterium]
MNRFLHIIALMPLVAASVSCGNLGSDVAPGEEHALVVVGSQVLTQSALNSDIPYGLSHDDSVKFVRAYVRQWIDARLVGEIAARNIGDMSRIDKMVEDYRNELIMWEYSRSMYAESSQEGIDRDSLRGYYEKNRDDYRATSPIVKGIFVKMPANDRRLPNIRKWVMSKNSDDLDRLEQASMDENVEYEYFRDEWMPWHIAARKFPVDISGKLASIPASGEHRIEITGDSLVYMLAVSEFLPVGSVMPFELVEEMIVQQFRSAHRPEYERGLRQQLYEKGVSDGLVKVNIDLGIPDVAQQDKNNK